MIYYFKKYITVFKTQKNVYIYHNKDNNKSLSFILNDNIINKIQIVLEKGIEEDQIKKDIIYNKLFKNDFLYTNKYFQKKKEIKRTELFLNYLYNDLSEKELISAKSTKLLIYGAGGAGSSLIYLLAQFGFKNMTIVDFDIVETSDVFRTMRFQKKDIARQKIKVLQEDIKNNFSIDIEIIEGSFSEKEELKKLVKNIDPDFIINACDPKPSFKLNLNEICFKYKIPYITLAYSYELILIGPIYIPSITSCENSFDKLVQESFGENHSYNNVENIFNDQLVHPSNSFNINILSSLGFKEILFFLLKKFDYCQTIGQRISFNPLTYNVSSKKATCDTSCNICQ
jgi:molybdopterin/thiamine biosynthesis adenylyltransferase